VTVNLAGLDHLVLTVRDTDATCAFYADVLGMEAVEFEGGRVALHFGGHKINLHKAGAEYVPHAGAPTPGSGDFCLITETPIAEVAAHLEAKGVVIERGPIARQGAQGPILSVYFRDPDGNLVEVGSYREG